MLHGSEDGKVTKPELKNGTKKTQTTKQKFLSHSTLVQLQKVDQKAAEALMAADPKLDALIPAGGGGDPLQGSNRSSRACRQDPGYRYSIYRFPSRPWRKTSEWINGR